MGHRLRWPSIVAVGLLAGTLSAQEARPTFEVASVRRSAPGTTGGPVRFLPGRFVAEDVSLEFILQQVYGVRDFQIVADPKWKAIITDQRYRIQATADEVASATQLKEMARALLADRFQLRLRVESRELPVYLLVPARGGAKGTRAADGRPSGGVALMARGWMRGMGVTTAYLAQILSNQVDRPVVDRTRLGDVLLNFDLTWTPVVAGDAGPSEPGCPPEFQEMAKRLGWKLASNCPSLFTAVQEQLGLRLDPQVAPLDVLVIDGVREPTEN